MDLHAIHEESESDDEEIIQQDKEIDVEDAQVKDRWSRYIGAMGIEAVAKQAESKVFLHGLGPLGIEIAKNIVLSGCKELFISDGTSVTDTDLDGQFFLSAGANGSKVAQSHQKLQQLNSYVKVTVIEPGNWEELIKKLRPKVLVMTETQHYRISREELKEISVTCR